MPRRVLSLVILGAVAGVLAGAGCRKTAAALERPVTAPRPPGEDGDAPAAGSGYGVGLARQAHIFRGDSPSVGASSVDPAGHARLTPENNHDDGQRGLRENANGGPAQPDRR
jgi:hypothetical protein